MSDALSGHPDMPGGRIRKRHKKNFGLRPQLREQSEDFFICPIGSIGPMGPERLQGERGRGEDRERRGRKGYLTRNLRPSAAKAEEAPMSAHNAMM